MKIYHYTNIESLALILQSKSIRFTRLDYVDDPDEYQFIRDGINPAQYVFVSCWTKSSTENIPQWKMYGANGHGVRIGLDEAMFSQMNDENIINIFDKQYFFDKDYFILPFQEGRYLPVYNINYVEHPEEQYDLIFRQLYNQSAVDFKQIGIYKNTDWSFQKECRFRIFVVPKKKDSYNASADLSNMISRKIFLERRSVDIPLNDEIYEKMEIMIGPNASNAENIIVQSLLQKYVRHGNFVKSIFTGKCR